MIVRLTRVRCVGLAFMAMMALIGCRSAGDQAFVGDWVSELDGLGLVVKANGEFEIQPTDGRAPVVGTWSEAEGVIEFRNSADSPLCPDEPGTYTWAMNRAGNLLFTLNADDCAPRIEHMGKPFDPVSDAAESMKEGE